MFDQFAARLTPEEWRDAESYVPAPMDPKTNPKNTRQPYFRVEREIEPYCVDKLVQAHSGSRLKP